MTKYTIYAFKNLGLIKIVQKIGAQGAALLACSSGRPAYLSVFLLDRREDINRSWGRYQA